ncbi:hypothetical protein [Algoriphagus sp. AK58]|uniref:hypothetical protein n=1 Tax=Algoriphagus sp. AK58 TaxID=1406877 RepID=UPI0016502276|nr:hypothetical protein [Algoriphagus sp. AK58]MBC6369167.1 hypothetical protein [Algoriphagus sp. AK58]
MSTSILSYRFTDLSLSNADGTKQAQVKNCTLGQGPGRVSGWGDFPSSFIFNGTGGIRVSLAKEELDLRQFSLRLIFRITENPSGRINLFEANSLPFSVFAMPGSAPGKYFLHASVHTKEYGWSSAITKFDYEMSVGSWVRLEIGYDLDTLLVKIDGRSRVIHAFPKGELKPGTGSTAFIGTWVDGVRNALIGEMAFLELTHGLPLELENELDQQRTLPAWHISYKYQDFKKDRDLGNPLGSIQSRAGSFFRKFERGVIQYHPSFGAFAIYGEILAAYEALGTALSNELGALISDEVDGRLSGVRKSVFQRGAIYWSSSSRAYPVVGEMYLEYESLGADSSVIGLPIGRYSAVGSGRQQVFQRGRMYHKNGSPRAFEVHGLILERYLALGGPVKKGFPISNELDVKNGTLVIGKISEFEACDIYWSASTGAYEIYGAIRENYDLIGGPLSALGFPTSNEENVPGAAGARMNTFKNGSIVWFPSHGTFICYPFEIHLQRVSTRDADDDIIFKDDSDIYAKIIVLENGHQVHSSVKPNSGTYSNTTEATLNHTVNRIFTPNQIHQTVVLEFQAWDSDNGRPFGGGDDNLGFYRQTLSASNAWGLLGTQGIFNRAGGSHGLKLDWSVRPRIPQGAIPDRNYFFWGASNRGTSTISWDTYADAFSDVTKGVNFFDHVSLKSLFYELVVKGLAASGNCFGMSLEGIYALKCMSRYGKPLNRFTWAQTEREFNIKHQYQVGANAIWWFVGQFITGNTHDPKRVFSETEYFNSIGNKPVICISQNYDFSGAPHCIYPHRWRKEGDNWYIDCFDPNNLDGNRTIHINARTNSFNYNNGRTYSGTAWTGGRFHYMPWFILSGEPRTPIWDAILLLLTGSVLIFADSGETVALTDSSGNNLNGGKLSQGEASRRHQMFIPFHGLNGVMGGNIYMQKGFGLSNNFNHQIRAKKTSPFSYGIANLNGELRYNTAFKTGEIELFQARKLGSQESQVSILSKEAKLYEVELSQKIGQEIIRTKIENIPTGKDRELVFSVQPGIEGIDIVSSGGTATSRISTEVYDLSNKLKTKAQFNLDLEGGIRLRNSGVLSTGVLSTSKIDTIKGAALDTKIILPR